MIARWFIILLLMTITLSETGKTEKNEEHN